MASTAISSQGTTIEIDVAIQGTPDVEIANVKSFSGLDGESSEIDVSNLSSTAKEYRVGLKENGSFSLEWNPDYSDSGQNAVRAAEISGAQKAFLITLPNGVTLAFDGFVSSAGGISGGVDGVLDGSGSIKVSGAVTVTTP